MLRAPAAQRLLPESIAPPTHLRTPLSQLSRSSQAQGRSLSVGQGRQASSGTLSRTARRAQRISAIAAPEAPTQEKCAPHTACLLQPYCCICHSQVLSLQALAGSRRGSSWQTLVLSDWLSWGRCGFRRPYSPILAMMVCLIDNKTIVAVAELRPQCRRAWFQDLCVQPFLRKDRGCCQARPKRR